MLRSDSSYFIHFYQFFLCKFSPVRIFFPVLCHFDYILYMLLRFSPSGPTLGFFHKKFLCTIQVQTLFFPTSAHDDLFPLAVSSFFHTSPYLIFPPVVSVCFSTYRWYIFPHQCIHLFYQVLNLFFLNSSYFIFSQQLLISSFLSFLQFSFQQGLICFSIFHTSYVQQKHVQ